jgi:hypothetical protein
VRHQQRAHAAALLRLDLGCPEQGCGENGERAVHDVASHGLAVDENGYRLVWAVKVLAIEGEGYQ